MVKTATNPEGLPIEVFDDMRSGLTKDRSQFYKDLAMAFYGANREGPRFPREFWISSGFGACRQASRTLMKASRPSPRPISPKTSRSSMYQPWLCMVRTTRSFLSKTQPKKSARLIKGAKEIYYPGAPHGLTATLQALNYIARANNKKFDGQVAGASSHRPQIKVGWRM